MSAPPSQTTQQTRVVDAEQPWLGLAHFSEKEHEFFFGREEQIALLFKCVRRSTLTILYGTSGRGKSSLIGAGLTHQLREAGHRVTLLRRDYDTLAEEPLVGRVIRAVCRDHELSEAEIPPRDRTLWQFFHDRVQPWCGDAEGVRGAGLAPVLIFDQFEEIFSKGEDHDRDRRSRARARKFLAQLADLVENRMPATLRRRINRCSRAERMALLDRYDFEAAPVRVVLVLRADFLARLERLRGPMPSVMLQRIELPDLTGEQALKAVFEPGAKRDSKPPIIPRDIAEQIVRTAANVPADAPLKDITSVPAAILSLLCEELNEARLQSRDKPECVTEFTPRGADTILEAFYEKKMACHARIRPALERMLAPTGARETPTVQAVLAALSHVADARRQIVEELPNERILVIDRGGRAERVEFTHDKLAEIAKRSADARAATERFRRRAAWAAAAAIAVALIAGWTALQWQKVARAEAAAQQARDTLAAQRSRVIKTLSEVGQSMGTQPTPADEYEATYKRLDEVAKTLAETPGQEEDMMRFQALNTTGLAWAARNRSRAQSEEEALGRYQSALEIYKKLAERHPTDAAAFRSVAWAQDRIAMVQESLGKKADAIASRRSVLEAYEKAISLDRSDWSSLQSRAYALRTAGQACRAEKRWSEADQSARDASEALSELVKDFDAGRFAKTPGPPSVVERKTWQEEAVCTIEDQAVNLKAQAESLLPRTPANEAEIEKFLDRSTERFEEALGQFLELQKQRPGDPLTSYLIGSEQTWLGKVHELRKTINWPEAAKRYEAAVASIKESESAWAALPKMQLMFATALEGAARSLASLGGAENLARARSHASAFADQAALIVKRNPDDTSWLEAWADGLGRCAQIARAQNDYSSAAVCSGYAVTVWETYLLNRPTATNAWREKAGISASWLARALEHGAPPDWEGARRNWDKALKFARAMTPMNKEEEQTMRDSERTFESGLTAVDLLASIAQGCAQSSSLMARPDFATNAVAKSEAGGHLRKARGKLVELLSRNTAKPPPLWLAWEMQVVWNEAFLLWKGRQYDLAEDRYEEGLKIAAELGGNVPATFARTPQGLRDNLEQCRAEAKAAATAPPGN